MLAAVLEEVGKMVLRQVPDPTITPNEVLLRVKACGICQTDYLAYSGGRTNWTPPLIVGHEISGVIEKVGADVTGWAPGDEVSVSPAVPCGECIYCRMGREHCCINGKVIGGEGQKIVLDGGFAELIALPTRVLYSKPDNVSFEAAALAEPLAGSYKGLIEYSQMRIGEDVVVIGAGSMGLLLCLVAVAAGAGTLIAVDTVAPRLRKALELGVHHAIDVTREDVKKRVYEILPGGPDLIMEAAGSLDAARLSFDLTRRGTRVNCFGVIIPGTILISPADVHFLETRVDASFSVNPRAMVNSLNLMRKGLVDPGKIVTHRFPLKDVQAALDTMKSPERVKIVIMP